MRRKEGTFTWDSAVHVPDDDKMSKTESVFSWIREKGSCRQTREEADMLEHFLSWFPPFSCQDMWKWTDKINCLHSAASSEHFSRRQSLPFLPFCCSLSWINFPAHLTSPDLVLACSIALHEKVSRVLGDNEGKRRNRWWLRSQAMWVMSSIMYQVSADISARKHPKQNDDMTFSRCGQPKQTTQSLKHHN